MSAASRYFAPLSFCAALFGAAAAPAAGPAAPPDAPQADGFHTPPSLAWISGDHRLEIGTAVRLRTELWDAFADDTEGFTALRSRLRVLYGWKDRISVTAELQDVRLYGMDPDGSGALATHRNANGGGRSASGTDLRWLFVEAKPTEASFLRVGRQEVKLGPEVLYPEPDWRYLKTSRVGERLIGSVGWSHEERAGDGVTAGLDLGGHHLFGFAARPTTGVFAVEAAYRPLRDIRYAGGSWTVTRGSALPNTELSFFGVAYEDERKPRPRRACRGDRGLHARRPRRRRRVRRRRYHRAPPCRHARARCLVARRERHVRQPREP